MQRTGKSPWSFVPTLYLAQAIPYSVVMILSVILFKKLGLPNSRIAFWTSLLGIPWVIKPLWSPLVELYWTRRRWVWLMQLSLGLALAALASGVLLPAYFAATLAVLGVVAVLSATHDIAADGFYIHGLALDDQARFSGIRNTFYRLGMILCQGVLVVAAGYLETHTGLPPVAVRAQVVPVPADAISFTPPQVDDSRQVGLSVQPRDVALRPGHAAKISLKLTARPADGIRYRVFFGRKTGSHRLRIKDDTGGPVLFDATNWDRPVAVQIQADARAGRRDRAEFVASSGNVPLSWCVIFSLLAAVMTSLALYHRFILPRPATDAEDPKPKPALAAAVARLALLTVLPMLAAYVLLKYILHDIGQLLYQAVFTASGFSFRVGGTLLLVALLAASLVLLIRLLPLTRLLKKFFHFSSSGLAFEEVFVSFFRQPRIYDLLFFLLIYRLGEAQLVRIAPPFLLDTQEAGGLALDTAQVGMAYGGVGLACLLTGGVLGGFLIARDGLKKWMLPMWACINFPHLLYVYLAWAQPDRLPVVWLCVGLEQLGYGIGFSGYMVAMLQIAGAGRWKTAHYSICTGLMALGVMLPGMISGYLQEMLGYKVFFLWVCLCTIPGLWAVYLLGRNSAFLSLPVGTASGDP